MCMEEWLGMQIPLANVSLACFYYSEVNGAPKGNTKHQYQHNINVTD